MGLHSQSAGGNLLDCGPEHCVMDKTSVQYMSFDYISLVTHSFSFVLFYKGGIGILEL